MSPNQFRAAPGYLTFSDIIIRLNVPVDPMSLMLVTQKQAICINADLSDRYTLNNMQAIVRLPQGCRVQRGFDVNVDDTVAAADQYKVLSFTSYEGQNYLISIQELINDYDRFDPDS